MRGRAGRRYRGGGSFGSPEVNRATFAGLGWEQTSLRATQDSSKGCPGRSGKGPEAAIGDQTRIAGTNCGAEIGRKTLECVDDSKSEVPAGALPALPPRCRNWILDLQLLPVRLPELDHRGPRF